jgi:uncharacterized GH25 family protein
LRTNKDKPSDSLLATFSHEDYTTLEDWTSSYSSFLPDKDGKFKGVFTLPDGISVKGRVTDVSGKPIVDALVVGHYRSSIRASVSLKTDENGEFAIKNMPESELFGDDCSYLAVRKEGFKTALESFAVKRAKPPVVNFVLKPVGKPIKIKIVDKEGKPVPNYMICLESWKQSRLIDEAMLTGKQGQRGLTDENGQWTWVEAPDDEVVFDMMDGKHMGLIDVKMKARDEEYVFTVAPKLKISGNVLDDATGQPIPKFQVYLGSPWIEVDDPIEFEPVPNVGRDGQYRIDESYPRVFFQVKIEADGYEPSISRQILSDEGTIAIDFRLKKM